MKNDSERLPLSGKRVCFLVAHEFEDVELLYPLLRLSEEGASITVATLPKARHFHRDPTFRTSPSPRFGSTVPVVVLEEGKRYSHRELDDVKPGDADVFIIPGGFSPDYLRIDSKVLELIAEAYGAGKLIAAICHGPQVLISVDRGFNTGMARNRKVTAYQAVRDDLSNAGGTYMDVPAIEDGHVITGRVPDDLPEFCRAIIEYLAAQPKAPVLERPLQSGEAAAAELREYLMRKVLRLFRPSHQRPNGPPKRDGSGNSFSKTWCSVAGPRNG